eukprot:gene10191-2610_t
MLTSDKEEIDNPISINKSSNVDFTGEEEEGLKTKEEKKKDFYSKRKSSKRRIFIPKLESTDDELLSLNLRTSKPPPDTSVPRQAPKTVLPGVGGTTVIQGQTKEVLSPIVGGNNENRERSTSNVQDRIKLSISKLEIYSNIIGISSIIFLIILFFGSILRVSYISLLYYFFFMFNFIIPNDILILNIKFTPRFIIYFPIMIISFLFLITQFSFQIIFEVYPLDWYNSNEELRNILFDFGIFRFKDEKYYNIILGFIPDLLIFISSILIFILFILRRIYNSKNKINEKEKIKRMNEKKNYNYLNIFKQHFIYIGYFIAASSHPSIFTSVYFIFYFLTLIIWSFSNLVRNKFKSFPKFPIILILLFWLIISFYTFISLTFINLSRFRYFYFLRINIDDFSNQISFWGKFIGFFDLNEIFLKTNEYQILFLISSLFYIYISTFIILNQVYTQYKINRYSLNNDILTSSSSSSFLQLLKYLPWIKWIINESPKLVLFPFLLFSVLFPSLTSMYYLILVCFGILTETSILRLFMPFTLLYSFLIGSTQFTAQIPGVFNSGIKPFSDEELYLIRFGFSKIQYPFTLISGQCLIAYFSAIALFDFETIMNSIFGYNMSGGGIGGTNGGGTTGFGIGGTNGKYKLNKIKRQLTPSKWVQIWNITTEILSILQNIFIYGLSVIFSQSYYLTLGIVYIACLYPNYADLLHLFYLVFFILLFVFPSIVKSFWVYLVIYSEIVTISLYFFNIISTQTNRGDIYKFIGLIRFGNDYNGFDLFIGIIWHIFILVFSGIQLYVLRSELSETDSTTLQKVHKGLNKLIGKEKIDLILIILNYLFDLIQEFITYYFLVCCLVIMSLFVILDENVNLIYLSFIIIVQICIFLSVIKQHNSWKLINIFWFSVVVWSGLVFFLIYIYQFNFVHEFFELNFDNSSYNPTLINMKEIGFIVFENKATGLLPSAIILLLNIIQLKNFSFRVKKENDKKKEGKIKLTSEDIENVFEPNIKKVMEEEEDVTKVEYDLDGRYNNNNDDDDDDDIITKINTILPILPDSDENLNKIKIFETKEQKEKKKKKEEKRIKQSKLIFTKGNEMIKRMKDLIEYIELVFKRIMILHMPKIMIIILFIASQNSINSKGTLNMIGLIYFLISMIIIPIPYSLTILWIFILIYSQINVFILYSFQFPYFNKNNICLTNLKDHSNPCNWFEWIGLIKNQKTGTPILNILIIPILVQLTTMFLRMSIRIRNNLKDKYIPGFIFDELKIKFYKQTFIQKLISILNFIGNRIFYSMGFEFCLFVLLIGSLSMIKTIWGLVYLVLFGVCLILGKKQCEKGWRIIMIAIEFNILILFLFNIESIPYKALDLYQTLNDIWPSFSSNFKHYIVLKPSDFANNQQQNYLVILYIILYFISLQLNLYLNLNTSSSSFNNNNNSKDDILYVELSTTEILNVNQIKSGRMHVLLDKPKGIDFTKRKGLSNLIFKFIFFSMFPYIVLLLIFISGSAVGNASIIGIFEVTLCLLYINFMERVKWTANKHWIWIGFFFWMKLLIIAIYQIPFVIISFSNNDTKLKILRIGKNIFGLKVLNGTYDELLIEVFILAFFYIQAKIYDSKYYIFYLNSLYEILLQSEKRHDRNIAFRSERLMISLIKNMKEEARRHENMKALKEFKGVTGKDKEIYEKYKEIRNKQLDEVTKDLQEAFDSVAYEIRISKILQNELLNSEDKYKYLEDKIKSQISVRKNNRKRSNSIDSKSFEPLSGIDSVQSSPLGTPIKSPNISNSEFENLISFENVKKEDENVVTELNWKEKLVHFLESNIYYYTNLAIQFLETYTDIAEDSDQEEEIEENEDSEDDESVIVNTNLDSNPSNPNLDSIPNPNPNLDSNSSNNLDGYEITEMKTIDEEEIIPSLFNKENEIIDTNDEPIMIPLRKSKERGILKEGDKKKKKSISNFPLSFKIIDPIDAEKTEKKLKGLKELFSKLFNKILLYYYCHTDVMCYFLFVLSVMINPTIFSMLFVIFAFSYAAIQYPYPNQSYWIIVAFAAQFFVAIEYILKIVYKNQFVGELDGDLKLSNKYTLGNLFGWENGDYLLLEIGLYLLIVIFVKIHRDALTARGDWEMKTRNKTKEKDPNEMFKKIFIKMEPLSFSKPNSDLMTLNKQEQQQEEEEEGKEKNNIEESINPMEDENIYLEWLRETFFQYVNSFKSMIDNKNKIGGDYYFAMITVELAAFVLFLLTFQTFTGREADDITGSINSDELSGTLVIILILFFMIMIVDRIIYLFTSLFWKIVFHYFLVTTYSVVYLVVYHLLQIQTFSNSYAILYLNLLFTLKCIYLMISSTQIGYGYSSTTKWARLTKNYTWTGYYTYEAWRKIPFIYELKMLLDWSLTPTSLTWYYWMKLEDIHATIFRRKLENDYWRNLNPPRPIGEKQSSLIKIGGGFTGFILICGIIFFPLLFFSSINPIQTDFNSIEIATTEISLQGYGQLFKNHFVKEKAGNYIRQTSLDPKYQFTGLDPNLDQLQIISTTDYSENYWTISNPAREGLIQRLKQDSQVQNPKLIESSILISYEFIRIGPENLKTVKADQHLPLSIQHIKELAEVMNFNSTKREVVFNNAYNPWIFNRAKGLSSISHASPSHQKETFPNCTLSLQHPSNEEVWHFTCEQPDVSYGSNKINSTGPFYYIQSTKITSDSAIFYGVVNVLSSFGIITFYTTFILAIGTFLSTYASYLIHRIYYEDLDNVELLNGFVNDIYAARYYKDFELEEIMFLQLLRIYRNQYKK